MVDPASPAEAAGQFRTRLSELCDSYLAAFPDEKDRLAELRLQIANPAVDLGVRSTIPEGHVTAAAIVLSSDASSVLMVRHKTLGIWVVPGGHHDTADGLDLSVTAVREFNEETGFPGALRLHPWHAEHGGIPLDIDTHPIPANDHKGEGKHRHFDFRYVFVMSQGQGPDMKAFDAAEVTDMEYVPLTDMGSKSSFKVAAHKLIQMKAEFSSF